MSEFAPVSTLADLDALDEAEVLEGYRDGLANEPEPGNNRSRSYWHGWRNGMSDRGNRPVDGAQMELAHAYLERSRKSPPQQDDRFGGGATDNSSETR